MNITISSLYFYPELTGIGIYSYELAKYLAENYHKVNVLTTFPFYPAWKRQSGYPRKMYHQESFSGINICRCYTYVPEHPSTIGRIIHEVIYCLLIFFRLLIKGNCDLLICISPPFFSMAATALISKLKKVPLLIHIQDLQPDAAIELGMIRSKFVINILKYLEMFSYKTSKIISSIGRDMNRNILSKGIEKEKLWLFSNWVNMKEISRFSKDPLNFRKNYNLENNYIVLHAGNIGEKHGLSTILHTAQIAQQNDENLRFIIAGAGVQKQLLIKTKEELGLHNVIFLDVQPKEEFYDMLLSADISLVMLRKEVKEIAIPSKLLRILGTGSPVIASVNSESEVAKLLKCLPVDVTVPPEDPEALYYKIRQFKEKAVDLDLLRCSEKELAQNRFSSEIILKEILSQIEKQFG